MTQNSQFFKDYAFSFVQESIIISEEEAKQKTTQWPNTTLVNGHTFYNSKHQMSYASISGKWTTISGSGYIPETVLWCPSCNEIRIIDEIPWKGSYLDSTAEYESPKCKCGANEIKINTNTELVEKKLEEKGSTKLTKEELVEILL